MAVESQIVVVTTRPNSAAKPRSNHLERWHDRCQRARSASLYTNVSLEVRTGASLIADTTRRTLRIFRGTWPRCSPRWRCSVLLWTIVPTQRAVDQRCLSPDER